MGWGDHSQSVSFHTGNHEHNFSTNRESVLQHFMLHLEAAGNPLGVIVAQHLSTYHDLYGCPLDDITDDALEMLNSFAAVPGQIPAGIRRWPPVVRACAGVHDRPAPSHSHSIVCDCGRGWQGIGPHACVTERFA